MKRFSAFLFVLIFCVALCPHTAAVSGAPEQAALPAAGASCVRVSVVEGLVLQGDVSLTVSLVKNADEGDRRSTAYEETILLSPSKSAETEFHGLSEGSYTLSITAPGFAAHRQTFRLDGWDASLSFCTGFANGYLYERDVPHPGVLLPGDVDGNGVLDASDSEKLAAALQDGSAAARAAPYADLNRDGDVTLADLELLAKTMQAGDCTAAVTCSVPGEQISARAGKDTAVSEADAAYGAVFLSREDGINISARTPVGLEYTVNHPVGAIAVRSFAETPVCEGTVHIRYTKANREHTLTIPFGGTDPLPEDAGDVTVENSSTGMFLIDFGTQINVLTAAVWITGLQNSGITAHLTGVDFLEDSTQVIPAPAVDVPQALRAVPGNEKLFLSWQACANAGGYEIVVTDESQNEEITAVKSNSHTLESFDGSALLAERTYKIQVRAVGAAGRGALCEAVSASPLPAQAPQAPELEKTVSAYRSILLNWESDPNAQSYVLYYRRQGMGEYTRIPDITSNAYRLDDLAENAPYELYVTGVNTWGESEAPAPLTVSTTGIDAAALPQYGLLNTSPAGTEGAAITSVRAERGTMILSDRDEAGSALGVADQNGASYYALDDWDGGGRTLSDGDGLLFTFDKPYTIRAIAVAEPAAQSAHYGYARIACTDGTTGEETAVLASVERRTDAQGRVYYWLRLPQAVTARALRLGLSRAVSQGSVTVAEVGFYEYDPIYEEVLGLFADESRLTLRSDVTAEEIEALRTRLQTPAKSGECHPDSTFLAGQLAHAAELLACGDTLSDPVTVHPSITASDVDRGFGGLNAWQPLGVTAAAGETVTVYVSHSGRQDGEQTELRIVATQYHGNSADMSVTQKALHVGRNELTIPRLISGDMEAGGALYVQYAGDENAAGTCTVRVSGGQKIPVLDLYRVTDPKERLSCAIAYVGALDDACARLEAVHDTEHADDSAPVSTHYTFDEKNCLLGASDILTETVLLSVPAPQLLAGLGNGSVRARAEKLLASMDAMEQMMTLFYQHKGLHPEAENEIDRYPLGHLNIRYQRMPEGAYMYAAGDHIGIEWDAVTQLANGSPVQTEEGRYKSGQYFGWGIAHEIGHCLDQDVYAVPEITNNYFALLAQTRETNASARFSYEDVFEKVTSGTVGLADSALTQLGMYWQLHLAYDTDPVFTVYETHAQQLNSLFYARVGRYARTPSAAPQPRGIALTLTGGAGQCFMRLACAAAQRNLLDFFTRWGMTPDETTQRYAQQFPAETRAIWYDTDAAHAYRRTHASGRLSQYGGTYAVSDETSAALAPGAADTVVLTLASTLPEEDVLGYEIVRCTRERGEVVRETVGFTAENTFRDRITTMNQRAVYYEVAVIDPFLNRSAVRVLDPVRIEHRSGIDKTQFTVRTAGLDTAETEALPEAGEGSPCIPEALSTAGRALDNDIETAYHGTVSAENGACVTVEFHRELSVEGFSYASGGENCVKSYAIRVRDAQNSWREVARGQFSDPDGGTVYFTNGKNTASYRTSAIQLVILDEAGTEIDIAELSAIGTSTDRIDWGGKHTEDVSSFRMEADYTPASGTVIPAGSVVFTGTCTGDPTYTTVTLYDQNGRVVGGMDGENMRAKRAVFADGTAADARGASSCVWFYWIEPASLDSIANVRQVRAELWRSDGASPEDGGRIVSDTLFEAVPAVTELQAILPGSGKGGST